MLQYVLNIDIGKLPSKRPVLNHSMIKKIKDLKMKRSY